MSFHSHSGARRAVGFLLATALCCWAAGAGAAETLQQVMKKRGLSQENLLAAAKTYTPTGGRDEFIAFSSGGQSGMVIVYGVPSMRILKYIAVFNPEPWQAYGFDDESKAVLDQGRIDGREITWGDTHHPAISETNGDYDGQYLFINDKANPRLAVIDLHDFETKQIVVNPVFQSEHGGAFVSENTEYVIEAAQYAAPLGGEYAPLELFNEKYRGGVTYWKFDREKGRLDAAKAFSIELPPYSQDLSDFGKLASTGWSFTNSFCSERYVGGIERGRPPFEAGCSAKDTDYLHVINWRKAAQVAAAGKVKKINGHPVIMMDTAIKEGLVFLIPEPKSPHGIDVTPDGDYMVVSGKLDTHATVYSWKKIKAAIDNKDFADTDPYGLPILDMQKVMHTQVQLGLGPLHTQYDAKKGIAYTSLYVDSMVGRWDYINGKLLDRILRRFDGGSLGLHQRQAAGPNSDPLQHRPPHDDARGHREAAREVPGGAQQARDRPLQPGGTAAPAEPPAHRHRRRHDAAALRHAGTARRAPLLRRDRVLPAQAGDALQGGHQQPHQRAVAPQDPGGRGAHRQERQQGRGLRHADPLPHHARDHRGRRR
jgi:nitrous-oxide reductase